MNQPSQGEGVAHALTAELFELSTAIDLVGQATASQLGINQTDLMCLNLLQQRGPMGAGEVAAALGLTTAAISAMATRLEAGGYAYREIDPHDRRRIMLHPSPSGVERAFSLFDCIYKACIGLRAEYSDDQQLLLIDLLRRFREIIGVTTADLRAGRNDPAT